MSKLLILYCITAFCALAIQAAHKKPLPVVYLQPEQVHLSLGEQQNEMIVTWTTFNETLDSTCHFGIGALNQTAHGKQTKFVDGGELERFMFIHRVALSNLKADTQYRYHCGSSQGWSNLFSFKTFPEGTNWSPKFVIYGDLGNINGQSLGPLAMEAQSGQHDLVIHAGDLAYDLHTDNALNGDEFMRQIEPIAAYMPYQVCPGNHENNGNFSNYVNRFSMHSQGSKDVNNFFWSYNIGPAHVIAFTTEFHFYIYYGTKQIMNQYRWLEADLKEANKPENRAKHPWLVTIGHRPFFTQSYVEDTLRLGIKGYEHSIAPGFEDLFYNYGVDLQFYGHEHNYERMWPIYNNTIYNGSLAEPYRNPKAPVHIITGSAGMKGHHTKIHKDRMAHSAFIIEDYGFTHMQVLNSSHIHIQQVSDDKGGKIVDDFFLIKEKHGPEAWKH